MEKKEDKKVEKLSQKEIERLEILQKADEVKGEQLSLSLDSFEIIIENEAAELIGQKIDNPSEKYELYYKALRNLLMSNLPKGKEFEDARQIVYDEKNILITRGHKKNNKGIRGADGRMAYIEDLEMAIKIVADWVSIKGSPLDIYTAFAEKNRELGYENQD